MTPSPPSCKVVPSRPAPPVPLQARPLPPPPVPEHLSTAELVVPSITSSPSVPVRSKSLNHRLAAGDSLDSNIFTSGSYSEHSGANCVYFVETLDWLKAFQLAELVLLLNLLA